MYHQNHCQKGKHALKAHKKKEEMDDQTPEREGQYDFNILVQIVDNLLKSHKNPKIPEPDEMTNDLTTLFNNSAEQQKA